MIIFSLVQSRASSKGRENYFFGFIGAPQQTMSHASTQPQTSSTETTSPQVRQANLLPFFTAFFFVAVLFFVVAVFFVFVAKAIPPFVDFSWLLQWAKQSYIFVFLDCLVAINPQNDISFEVSVLVSFRNCIRMKTK